MDNGASSYRRFLDGDDSALAEIIREYRLPLQNFLFSLLKNDRDAEEATIETFVKLAEKRPRYKEKASFKTWLFTIGRNAALDILRKKHETENVPLEGVGEVLVSLESNPEKNIMKSEQTAALITSMKKLSPDYCTALWLMYFEDMTVKETAQIMKKSEGAVKTLLSRARNALKEQLLKDGYDYEI